MSRENFLYVHLSTTYRSMELKFGIPVDQLLLLFYQVLFVFFRTGGKGSRRECKHRAGDGTNGLGILPSDYLDRGDGHLIGLDSFTGLNRSLLLPKVSPVSSFFPFPIRASLRPPGVK